MLYIVVNREGMRRRWSGMQRVWRYVVTSQLRIQDSSSCFEFCLKTRESEVLEWTSGGAIQRMYQDQLESLILAQNERWRQA